jgi:hypothetical protein
MMKNYTQGISDLITYGYSFKAFCKLAMIPFSSEQFGSKLLGGTATRRPPDSRDEAKAHSSS